MQIEYYLQKDDRPGYGRFRAIPVGLSSESRRDCSRKRRIWAQRKTRNLPTVEIVLAGDEPLMYAPDGNFGKDAPRRALPSLPADTDFITLPWDIKLLYVAVLRTLDAELVQQALSRLASQFLDRNPVEVRFLDFEYFVRHDRNQVIDLATFLT